MMRVADAAHCVAGVRFQHAIRSRFSGAEQRETFGAILTEVATGIVLIDCAFDDARRAGEAPALETAVRQVQPGFERDVEDVAVAGHRQRHFGPVRKTKGNLVRHAT